MVTLKGILRRGYFKNVKRNLRNLNLKRSNRASGITHRIIEDPSSGDVMTTLNVHKYIKGTHTQITD